MTQESSNNSIKQAYYRLAQLYHPDKIESDVNYEAHEHFLLISEAYDVLGNPDLRSQYDDTLKNNASGKITFNHPFAVSRAHAGYAHQHENVDAEEEFAMPDPYGSASASSPFKRTNAFKTQADRAEY